MTADDQFHGHVAREGVVDEHVDAPVGAGFHDGVALLDLVGIHDDVSGLGDDGRVFCGTPAMKRISSRPISRMALKAGVAPGTACTMMMAFTAGSAGEGAQLGDGGLLLGHELIRIGVGDDVVRILRLESFRGAELFLALGGGAGQ